MKALKKELLHQITRNNLKIFSQLKIKGYMENLINSQNNDLDKANLAKIMSDSHVYDTPLFKTESINDRLILDNLKQMNISNKSLYQLLFSPKQLKETNKLRLVIFINLLLLIFLIFFREKSMTETQIELLQSLNILKNFSVKKFDASMGNEDFGDVIGNEEIMAELKDIVVMIKNPALYNKRGVNPPKGVLLSGPPGTGKTLLARALAKETGCNFFYVNASEFEEALVGMGAKRIRELFKTARLKKPSIIFIDEIDSIGKRRDPNIHSVYRQCLNQLLSELDGFSSDDRVLVIGATNRKDILDSALLRSGRFDRKFSLRLPNENERIRLLQFFLDRVKHENGLNIVSLARRTIGMSGSDLKNIVNTACIDAVMDEREEIGAADLDRSFTKQVMGLRNVSSKEDSVEGEARKIAVHEVGHALAALLIEPSIGVHSVTILANGNSLGHTAMLPSNELSLTKEQLLRQVDSLLGSRVAEELFLGKMEVSTGCQSDLISATKQLNNFFRIYGMEEEVFCGNAGNSRLPEAKTREIELEIEKYLNKRYSLLKSVFLRNKELFGRVVEELVDKETLSSEQLMGIIKNI